MIALLRDLPDQEKEALVQEEPRSEPNPMLAVLTRDPFSDPGWLFERKLDGERVLAVSGRGDVRLMSRNGKNLSSSYPRIVDALEESREPNSSSRTTQHDNNGGSFVLDGEVVSFSGSVTSFARLRQRIQIRKEEEARESPITVYYYVFDLLHLSGYDVRRLPLRTRKTLLKCAFRFQNPLRLSRHLKGRGEAFLVEACRKGWEGIMAKRADAPYRPGRSRDWLKFKCVHRQELVIGGYTEPGGSRTGFGALLVGHQEHGSRELRYAGKVGTGFDEESLERISRLLKSRVRKTPPFSKQDKEKLPKKDVHWVTPNLVGQFGFAEWTGSGKLRHPRFLGLRRDKDPEEVFREDPR